MILGTRSELGLRGVNNLCFTRVMTNTATTAPAAEDIIRQDAALINEARGWAMDAYDLASLPSAARALELIRNGYAGGAAEFIRNSSQLISN